MITGELWGLKYQTGLRFEYAQTKGHQKISGDSFNNHYSEWYPSIHVAKELSEGSEILLSLSRRVDRPRGRQLNPFVSLADSQNVTQGNPALKPQFTNSYELGYSMTVGKTTATSTIFYRHSTGIITSISYLIDNNITKTTYANIDKSNSYGLEVTLVQPIASWWRLNANASYYNTEYVSSTLSQNINKSNYSWLGKINSMMQLPYGVQFQIMMNYNAPVIMPQSKVKAIFTSDIALKKDLLDGKVTMTLRVSDILHSQKTMTETSGTNFLSNSTDLRGSRVAYLGVSYRIFNFNKSEERNNKENGDAMDY
jgi:outer membrane receptor protein involved in Fe transport